jgi:hypothetical protein
VQICSDALRRILFLPGRSRYSVEGTEYADYVVLGSFWKIDLIVVRCLCLLRACVAGAFVLFFCRGLLLVALF